MEGGIIEGTPTLNISRFYDMHCFGSGTGTLEFNTTVYSTYVCDKYISVTVESIDLTVYFGNKEIQWILNIFLFQNPCKCRMPRSTQSEP